MSYFISTSGNRKPVTVSNVPSPTPFPISTSHRHPRYLLSGAATPRVQTYAAWHIERDEITVSTVLVGAARHVTARHSPAQGAGRPGATRCADVSPG